MLSYFKWIWESIINAFINTRSINASPYLKSDTTYEEALLLYEIPKTLHETSMLKERMHLSKRTRFDFYMPLSELYWRSKRAFLTKDAILYAKKIKQGGASYFNMRRYKYLYKHMELGWTTLEDDFVFSKMPLLKNLNLRWYKPLPGKDQILWKYIKPINPLKAPFHGSITKQLKSYDLNKYKQSMRPSLIIDADYNYVSKLEEACKPQLEGFDYNQLNLLKYIFKTHQDYLLWLQRLKSAYFYSPARRLINEKIYEWYLYAIDTKLYYSLALKVYKLNKHFTSRLAFNKKPSITVETWHHISDVKFSDQDILNLHSKKIDTGHPWSQFVLRVPWRWRRKGAYSISDFTWNPVKNKTLQNLKTEDVVDYAFYKFSQDIKEIFKKRKYIERKIEPVFLKSSFSIWMEKLGFKNWAIQIENEKPWSLLLNMWMQPFNFSLQGDFSIENIYQALTDLIYDFNYVEEISIFGDMCEDLEKPTPDELDEILCWETYSPSVHIMKEAFELLTNTNLPYFYRYFMLHQLKFDYIRTINKDKTINNNVDSTKPYIPTYKFNFDVTKLKHISLVNRYWNDLFSTELKTPMPRFKFCENIHDQMLPDFREKWSKFRNKSKALKYKNKHVDTESLIDLTPIYQNYMRLEFNDNINYWYRHAFDSAEKFNNIKYHMMDKYLHQMHKGVAPSDYFTCLKFKFIDNLLDIIINYSNVYTITLVIVGFTVAFFIHIFKLIKKSDLLKPKQIAVSNKKIIKNNKNIKIIKRFYHSSSNQYKRDKKLMFQKTRKSFIETLWKSLQKIINNKGISFSKNDIRLSFKVERGKLYKLDVLDFQAKTSNLLNIYDDTNLIDYASTHNVSKHGNVALSQFYLNYFDINELDIYKYDHPIEFTCHDYLLSKKRKDKYRQNRIKALIRDRERAFLLKKDMHFKSRFTDSKYKVLNFFMYISKYFKYIFKFIGLLFMFIMLSILLWINISYLILIFFSIQTNFNWWTGFFKSGTLFILSIILFYISIILLLFYVIIVWRINKNKVKTSKIGSEKLQEQYVLQQDKFKEHFLDEMRKLNADWALLDVDLIKQKEVSRRRLKKIYKIVLYIFFSICFIICIILLFMLILVCIKLFWSDFAVQMPSLWTLDWCFLKKINLMQTFLGDIYHKGAFFDDYHFVNLVFNLYRSHFWNDWFRTELEKWKINLFEQVWQTNKIFIEKSFIFAYFLKTLGESWIEDVPIEDRIDESVDYLKTMKFFLNETPFYFARYKTSLNSLKDRIINIKVWRLQRIRDFRTAYLRFKTNVVDNKNLYDNWYVHIHILKLLFVFNWLNLLYFFILVCILYFIITKVCNHINKQSKFYNDFMFFVNSYLKKNEYQFFIFRQYLLDKKQLSLYYRFKSTVSFINKIKTFFKKK